MILHVVPERGLALGDWARGVLAAVGPGGTMLVHEDDAACLGESAASVLTFGGGNLTAARSDLAAQRGMLAREGVQRVVLVLPAEAAWRHETYHAWLRLAGVEQAVELTPGGEMPLSLPPVPDAAKARTLSLTVGGGIGNVVLATPLVRAALDAGLRVFFRPVYDSDGSTLAGLFRDHGLDGLTVLGADDPGPRADLGLTIEGPAHLEPGDFYFSPFRVGGQAPDLPSEAASHAAFLRNAAGLEADVSATFVGDGPVGPRLTGRVVICPGSKAGWDAKRWPHFDALLRELARAGERPVVMCRQADLDAYGREPYLEPIRAQADYLLDLDLAGMAGLLRRARLVIANDCGPAHVAAAAGAPTLVLFGPSSEAKNAHPRPNVRTLFLDAQAMPCRPCQGRSDGPGRLAPGRCRCDLDFACLADLSVERVLDAARRMVPHEPMQEAAS